MTLRTILVVEDDRFTRHFLRKSLEVPEFIVMEASVGRMSIEIIRQHHIDAILFDLNLPDGCGLDFVREIRKHTDVPLLIVSGEEDVQRRIDCFTSGADDFVPKPFIPEELLARVRAHLRRYSGELRVARHRKDAQQIYLHDWVIDRARFQLLVGESVSVNLTTREFQLLDILVSHLDRVMRREDICETFRRQHNVPLTPRAVDIKITRIRKKIADHGGAVDPIKTIRGVGYLLSSSN